MREEQDPQSSVLEGPSHEGCRVEETPHWTTDIKKPPGQEGGLFYRGL